MANLIKEWFFGEEGEAAQPDNAAMPISPIRNAVHQSKSILSESNVVKESSAYKMLIAAIGKVETPSLESFQAALEAAADASVPEAMRYSFAFKMLAKMQGLTQAALLRELQVRVEALEAQRPIFEKRVEERRAGIINAKETERAAIQPEISVLKEQIEKLQVIEKRLTEEISEEQKQIVEISRSFNAALQSLLEACEDEKQKLERYLKTI